MRSKSSRPFVCLILFLLSITYRNYGQCPFSADLTGANLSCAGGELSVNTANTLGKITWYKDGVAIATITAPPRITTVVAGVRGFDGEPQQFGRTEGMSMDANGNFYIVDDFHNRVQKWAPGATSGVTVAGGNGWGSAMDQLAFPFSIHLDAAGNLYISDQYNYRVQKYAPPAPIDRNYTAVEAGSYTAVVTDINDCISTTNAVVIGTAVTPAVSIDAPASVVCAGSSVTFTAAAVNGGSNPVFQWQVNGIKKGSNSDTYIDPSPANGSVITCTMTSSATCTAAPTAVSAPVTLAVKPIATPGLTIQASATTISLGASVDFIAFPTNGGDNPAFEWQVNGIATGMNSPNYTSSNLSDGDIVICTITSNAVCATTSMASSTPITITAKALRPFGVPNAFTPNGDGNNDVFYVTGGPAGTIIRELAVFNRWGQRIFEVHGAPPGDKSYGWNGSYHGAPVPPGTYAYIIEAISADGKSQVIRGTVVLIR